jgi:peptidoglycan-N-acetylglucosamine deacetylase
LQIRAAAASIAAIGGGDPRPLFRFPYGARNATTITVANRLGYGSFRWTVDTLGWEGTTGGMTARRVVRRVSDGLRPGAIVLMHVGSHPKDHTMLDAAALDRVITLVRDRGYRIVTLRQVLP